jgi:predicted metal-dependent phosphoesterase TrpH
MAGQIDLHMHTNRSDGVLTPAELLERVRASGVRAFAVTDHDTLDGYRAVLELLQPDDPELISGVELSVDCYGEDLHLLGYLFDPDHEGLNSELRRFQEERNRRGRLMVQKLEQLGLDVPYDEVLREAGGSAIGRPHVAEAMVRVGAVSGFDEAFRKYIGNDGPAYVPKVKLTPDQAIDLVHGAGGVAVLAHPGINGMYRYVEELAGMKLDGIEVYHYSHSGHQVKQFKDLARRYHLLQSGGSDFHGRHDTEGEIGAEPVPLDYLGRLKQRVREIRGTF